MNEQPTAVALGVHVLDVLAKYVEAIPEGQGGALIEEIRLSPAGSAGGTAVTLAKLGTRAQSVGAIGSDDLGDVLVRMLERFGVDCAHLVRRDGVQTSSSVLPIRPSGERPALHVIGANGAYSEDDVPWDALERASFVHLGGPEFVAEFAPRILAHAREHGATITADVLADGWPELLEMISPALEQVDWFLPNREQACALSGADDVVAAGRALIARGAGGCAITCGADGSVVVTAESVERVPAFEVEVVDTTGCGDAFSAGFIRGLSLGREPRDCAVLGSACAALVAQGLGSDAGDFDLDGALGFADRTPVRSALP